MATTSFRRKKYGQVKPVKHAKAKMKKPDVRELTRYYAAIAKYGVWQQLDNVCYAMNWWDKWLDYYQETVTDEFRTTTQARKISEALAYRKQGNKATSDKSKIADFINSIASLESVAKLVLFKIPAMKEYIFKGEKAAKKNKGVLDALEPRFSRTTGLLAAMFPSCPMAIVVVPQIIDPVTGKELGRKFDHTKNTIYYSRKQIKAIKFTLRTQGYLAVALDEAWWLSRGMSFGGSPQLLMINDKKWLDNYERLLYDFEKWARRSDTPVRLAKKPAKPKKLTTDEVEERLTTGKVVSMEPIEKPVIAEVGPISDALLRIMPVVGKRKRVLQN